MQTDHARPGRTSLRALMACVLCLAACGACEGAEEPWNDDLLVSGEKLYSQHDEELIIRH